jgi:hypothetical protein
MTQSVKQIAFCVIFSGHREQALAGSSCRAVTTHSAVAQSYSDFAALLVWGQWILRPATGRRLLQPPCLALCSQIWQKSRRPTRDIALDLSEIYGVLLMRAVVAACRLVWYWPWAQHIRRIARHSRRLC